MNALNLRHILPQDAIDTLKACRLTRYTNRLTLDDESSSQIHSVSPFLTTERTTSVFDILQQALKDKTM